MKAFNHGVAAFAERVNTLFELCNIIIGILQIITKTFTADVRYVSGIISSAGPEKILSNLQFMREQTELLIQNNPGVCIFAPTSVFTDKLHIRFTKAGTSQEDYNNFWERVLRSGFIKTMYMLPGWEASEGAKREHKIAKELGMKIIYVEIICVD